MSVPRWTPGTPGRPWGPYPEWCIPRAQPPPETDGNTRYIVPRVVTRLSLPLADRRLGRDKIRNDRSIPRQQNLDVRKGHEKRETVAVRNDYFGCGFKRPIARVNKVVLSRKRCEKGA
ncbi:hypothetical protein RRG08_046845 [Elysia crispata]|uniref:Uncharacterized protein n=1 Tax=Elysia crispata TaxID=231223 RepID=A0AAE1DJN4_9GAST|nr:hypothetical protein RRG08_046845 [Elysia crispata]